MGRGTRWSLISKVPLGDACQSKNNNGPVPYLKQDELSCKPNTASFRNPEIKGAKE